MKSLLRTAAVVCCLAVLAQPSCMGQSIKELGWAVELPEEFEVADSTLMALGTLKSTEAGEQIIITRYGLDQVRNLIGASKGQFNYFNANVNTSGLVGAKNWIVADQSAKQVYFNSFNKQVRFIKVDSGTVVQKINGVEFEKFQATCYINSNNIFTVVHMGAFYKEKYINILYYYMDHSAGTALEKMLVDSKSEQ